MKKLVEEAPATMHWLEGKGLGFGPKVRVIVGGLYPRGHGAEGGGYGYIRVLEKFIKAYPDKVKVFTDTQAVKLIKNEAGKVIGVWVSMIVKTSISWRAKASSLQPVVLVPM